MSEKCNYCVVEHMRSLAKDRGDKCEVRKCGDGGWDMFLNGQLFSWFSDIPDKCVCKKEGGDAGEC